MRNAPRGIVDSKKRFKGGLRVAERVRVAGTSNIDVRFHRLQVVESDCHIDNGEGPCAAYMPEATSLTSVSVSEARSPLNHQPRSATLG